MNKDNKSSDEILNELYNSLNLPVSPDSRKANILKTSKYSDESSDNSYDTDVSGSSDDELCTTATFLNSEAKTKSHKKRDKKKKKKLKKENKSKHKKSKKKKESFESDEDDKVSIKTISMETVEQNVKTTDDGSDDNLSITVKHKTVKEVKSKHKRSRSRSRSPQKAHSSSYTRSESESKSRAYRSRKSSSSSRHRSYSRSHSRSPYRNGRQKSKHYRSPSYSRSPSPRKLYKRTRSRSTSPVKESKDPLDTWRMAKLASLKKTPLAAKLDLELYPPVKSSGKGVVTDHEKMQSKNSETLPVDALDTIPLPVPAPDFGTKTSVTALNTSEIPEEYVLAKEFDLNDIPIPEQEANYTSSCITAEDYDSSSYRNVENILKAQEKDKNRDEGKSKTIVIKSLKDSLVLQQAEAALNKEKPLSSESTSLHMTEQIADDANADATQCSSGNDRAVKSVESNESAELSEITVLENDVQQSAYHDETTATMEESSLLHGDSKITKEKTEKKDVAHHSEVRRHGVEKKSSKKSRSRSRSQSTVRRRSRSRSRRKMSRSRSGSRSRRKSRKKSWSRSRRKSYSRSRSRTRHRAIKSRSRSHSHSKRPSHGSKRKKSPDCVDSLRDKATRKRLLEVARKNAVYLMKNNCLPPSIEKESVRATGKSVEELTSFCKQLVAKEEFSEQDMSDPSLSPDEGDLQFEKPFGAGGRHPFAIKDNKPILMNIRNAPMLPLKSNAERLADASKLREQFPVSSGSQHRTKEGWVVVEKNENVKDDKVFPEKKNEVDISSLVSARLSAMRKLQDNPQDRDAIRALTAAQSEMQNWALSKQVPGQFTGSTGAKILSQEELSAGYQAWARKEQFKEANPVTSQFGLKMLQKMGWNPGEGLGKNKEGQIEPLLLDVKMDKKGLHAQQEITPKRCAIPLLRSLAGKHPVSALVEYCNKNKWQPPEFEMVFDGGPDHKKNFLMKVHVNNQIYQSAIATSTKKLAKANAAAACLQALSLIPNIPAARPISMLNTVPNQAAPATSDVPVPSPVTEAEGTNTSQQPTLEMMFNQTVTLTEALPTAVDAQQPVSYPPSAVYYGSSDQGSKAMFDMNSQYLQSQNEDQYLNHPYQQA